MSTATEQLFTSAQIAKALGVTPRAVRLRLKGVSADGTLVCGSNAAAAWRIDSLPAPLQAELETTRQTQYFRDTAALLTNATTPWRPMVDGQPIAWSELTEGCQERAAARCQALRPILELMHVEPVATSRRRDLEAAAARDLRMSPAQVRRWLDRVLARDGGRECFDLVELYLDEKLARKSAVVAAHRIAIDQLPTSILEAIRHPAKNLLQLSPVDRYQIWKAVLMEGESLEARTPDRRACGAMLRSLLELVLKAVPGLSRSLESALRTHQNFRRDGLKEDQRPKKSGNPRKQKFERDLDIVTLLAVTHGGNESLGQRQAYTRGLLSPEYVEAARLDEKVDKGSVPPSVRREITPRVNRMLDIHHGERQHDLARVRFRRDWSDCEPGDWFSGDDLTAPVYFRQVNTAGEEIITRGQLLVFNDERTGYILAALLLPRKSYTAIDIRRGVRKAIKDHGLPHFGFLFEHGSWAARLIDGENQDCALAWRDTERLFEHTDVHRVTFTRRETPEGAGLNDPRIGTRVRHALNPTAKSIEGIFALLQNLMEGEGMYIGRNEQLEKFEDNQRILGLARRGDREAALKIPTYEQWKAALARVIDQYNDTPQPRSKKLNGRTPRQAFEEGQRRRPARTLPPQMEYLLWSHAKRRKITKQGLVVTISGKPYHYATEGTGHREGEEVIAYWNIEDPSYVIATDLDGTNAFIARSLHLPATTATREEFAAAHAARRGHVDVARNEYLKLKHTYGATIARSGEFTDQENEIGERLESLKQQEGQRRRDESAARRKAEHAAKRLGIQLPESHPDPDLLAESLHEIEAIRNRRQQQKKETPV